MSTTSKPPASESLQDLVPSYSSSVFDLHWQTQGGCLRAQTRVASGCGTGYSDLREFDNGLLLGRADYRLRVPERVRLASYRIPLGFSLILNGCCTMHSSALGWDLPMQAGELWCYGGELGDLDCELVADVSMLGVSLQLPQALLERWQEAGCLVLPDQGEAYCRRIALSASQAELAAGLLRDSGAGGLVHDLQQEARALELLAALLQPQVQTVSSLTRRQRVALDDAVDILRQELAAPPSIASLSQRVGLNECSLKQLFRRQLGLSIGQFVRQQRMQRARALLRSGSCNVQQAALEVGYSNPSHFAAAYREQFGISPSAEGAVRAVVSRCG